MSVEKQMPFPEKEWKDIAKQLRKGSCSSVRCCYQLGKYKTGDIYLTPWGDKIKIEEVTRYSKAEDIPTWNLMDKGMKISVKKGEQYGNSQWDYVKFKKIN
jgi:hypothetical protein